MINVFGHHISLRAVAFAAFELAAFIAMFNISRATVLHFAAPGSTDLYGQAYLLPLCCFLAFATASGCGLYNKEVSVDPHRVVSRLVTASMLMYFLMAAMISVAEIIFRDMAHLRLYYAVTLMSAAGYFVAALFVRHKIFAFDLNNTILERRVLVLGVDECAAKVEYLNGASRSPYTVVGFVPVGHGERSKRLSLYKILPSKILETPTGLLEQARQLRADEIIVASRERRGLPLKALMECKLSGITVTEFASFWERQTGQIDLDELNPSWLIFSGGFRVTWISGLAKRAFDVFVSILLLIFTLPVTLLAAIAIRIEGRGPLFYRQERVGQNGTIFTIFKFRSMRTDAEKDGVARWAQNNDNRVTRVGRFLRRTRIDEIPQVINVLLGNMSFVGPRPERPVFVDALAQKIPHYDVRHRIKPGITGWAQINYPYGASDEDAKAKLAYDLYYAKNWGVFLDLVILFQTASVVLWPSGVR
jgi:sugar transferase (PEP-CTERM system associated)